MSPGCADDDGVGIGGLSGSFGANKENIVKASMITIIGPKIHNRHPENAQPARSPELNAELRRYLKSYPQ